MFKTHAVFCLLLGSIILAGCAGEDSLDVAADSADVPGTPVASSTDDASSLDATPDSQTPPDALESQTVVDQSADPLTEDSVLPAETQSDIADDSTTDVGGEDAGPQTADEYVAAINERLQPPTQDIPGAIAMAEEAFEKFPENEGMLRGLAALLYQSLRIESDEAVIQQRRLQLGDLARDLIERNKDSLDVLGEMPGILLLEEAKANLSDQNVEQAFALVKQARDFGFQQTELLFLDPSFAALINNEAVSTEIKQWFAEEIGAEIAQTEAFPFDFSLTSFTGEEVSLSDFAGKILIVDFWGTWCPPCRKEIPHFVELQENRADDLAIVGINIEDPSGTEVDFETAKASFEEFTTTQPINYPCVLGNRETVDQVPEFRGYPTTLFLDSAGRVRLKLTGYQPLEKLEAAVDYLLSNQTPTS